MKEITDIIIEVTFGQLFEVDLPKVGRFGLIVKYHNVNYKFLLNLIEGSDKLIALGSGALDVNSDWDRSRPRFSRWSWDFEDSTINYDDPTLYINDKILGSCCIGTEKIWYLKDISVIIQIISNKLNIENNNLLFYGSSAGGFTSLLLSILIKDSVSIAEIPQLDITTYGVDRQWVNIKKYCFGGQDDEKIISKFKYRFNVVELIKKENYIPNAFIIFDATENNFETQAIPFFHDLNKLNFSSDSNNLKFYIHGQNKGHLNLDYDELIPIIRNIKLLMEDRNSFNFKEMFNLNNVNSKSNVSQLKNIESKLSSKENEIHSLQNQLKSVNEEMDLKIHNFGEKEFRFTNKINLLSKELIKRDKFIEDKKFEFDNQMVEANNEISSLKDSLVDKERILKSMEVEFDNQMVEANNEISSLNDLLSQKENIFSQIELELNKQINNGLFKIQKKDDYIKENQQKLLKMEDEFNSLKNRYISQFNKINSKDYCISCFKEEISNNQLEIDYLKKNILIKKLVSPLSYVLLILNSNHKELFLNFKLYKTLKNSKCFDIGFYLSDNNDLQESIWYKFFSLELHYVCNGFNEGRKFNKKYFNRNSKIELLEYLMVCK